MTEQLPSTEIIDAEARVAAARERLTQTVGTLQTRLDPRIKVRETVDEITESGEKALRSGVETAKRNPTAVVSAATLLIAILARKRIAAVFRRDKPVKTPIAQPQAQRRVRLKPRPAPAKRNDP